jgi:hypothetical protein
VETKEQLPSSRMQLRRGAGLFPRQALPIGQYAALVSRNPGDTMEARKTG